MSNNIEWIKACAKQNLLTHGHVLAVVILDTPSNEMVVGIPYKDDTEKFAMLKKCAQVAKDRAATAVTFVAEVFVRTVKNTADAAYIKENWETERPSVYPDSMRSEAICISHTDILKKTCTVCLIPFERQGRDFVFGEEEVSEAGTTGFIPSLFLN